MFPLGGALASVACPLHLRRGSARSEEEGRCGTDLKQGLGWSCCVAAEVARPSCTTRARRDTIPRRKVEGGTRAQRRLYLLYSHSGESQRLAAGLAKEGHGLRGKDDERTRKLIRRRDRSRAREGLASRSSLRWLQRRSTVVSRLVRHS